MLRQPEENTGPLTVLTAFTAPLTYSTLPSMPSCTLPPTGRYVFSWPSWSVTVTGPLADSSAVPGVAAVV